MNHNIDRRQFILTIGTVGSIGTLAGCSDGGSQQSGGETPTQTDEPSTTDEEPSRETETGGEEGLQETVSEVNDVIEQVNEGGPDADQSLESTNERLRNVEDIDYVESVSVETPEEAQQAADRLRDERDRIMEAIRTRVPREINEQAPIELVEDPDQYQTPEDFREGADELPSQRASEAMNDAADGLERIDTELTRVADMLEDASE